MARGGLGFTLVELVAVLTLSSILGLVVWRNLSLPMRAFVDVKQRTAMVATARLALARMRRELTLALPNSVRVSSDGLALEMLKTSASGRYRADVVPGDATSDSLNLSVTSDSFQTLGAWTIPTSVRTSADVTACLAGSADCLVIYNTGNPSSCAAQPAGTRTNAWSCCAAQPAGTRTNAWCGDNLAGIVSAVSATGVISVNRAAAGTVWPTGSPEQRFFVVDTAVSFVCSGTSLSRYSGYALANTQPIPPSVSGNLLATGVAACAFSYQTGSATRAGLVNLSLTLSLTNPDGVAEKVTLFDQVHVPNSP